MVVYNLVPKELWGLIGEFLYADIIPQGDSVLITVKPCKLYTVYFCDSQAVMIPDCATQ